MLSQPPLTQRRARRLHRAIPLLCTALFMGGFPTDALAVAPIAPPGASGAVQHDTINWGGILQPAASGEWIVTFEPGFVPAQAHIDADPAAALLGELRLAGAPVESVRWAGRNRAVVVAPGVAPEAARAWMDHPALPIRHVEPNGLLAIPAANSASREVNDPRFSDQWGLRKIMAPEAWDITFGDEDIVVAVIDTGVELDHPDLVGNLFVNPRLRLRCLVRQRRRERLRGGSQDVVRRDERPARRQCPRDQHEHRRPGHQLHGDGRHPARTGRGHPGRCGVG